MRFFSLPLCLVLVTSVGCSSKPQNEVKLQAALSEIAALKQELSDINQRIQAWNGSLHSLDEQLKLSNAANEQLQKNFDSIRSGLASSNVSGKLADLLNVITPHGDQVVVRGLVVADERGAPRCQLTPLGFTVDDQTGSRVCEISYDERSRAMTASLRGQKRNSVALYASDDRAAIGAFDGDRGGLAIEHRTDNTTITTSLNLVKSNGDVGWAATVAPNGEVFAGKTE